jgi:multiple sugar transport system ATP-binding protein
MKFIGSPPMNFIKVRTNGGRAVKLGSLALEAPRDGEVVLGIRGEDLDTAESGLPLAVQVIEPLGPHLLLTGTHDSQIMRVVAPTQLAVRSGDVVQLRPRPGTVRWFDPTSGQALG